MNNEVFNALEKYFNREENTIRFFGSSDGPNFIAQLIQNAEKNQGDEPDALFINNEIALIVEHFEFDNTRNSKKGSQYRRELARIDRKKNELQGKEYHLHDKFHCPSSYENYINNVTESFKYHYGRISAYKENLLKIPNLISDSMEIKTMFLIEEVSVFGSIVLERLGTKVNQIPVVLSRSEEFINLLKSSKDVDYVLACSTLISQPEIWLIDNSEIESYSEHLVDYANMKFLNLEANVVSHQILIPKNI